MSAIALSIALMFPGAFLPESTITTARVIDVASADILRVQVGDEDGLVALYGVIAPPPSQIHGKLAQGFVEALVENHAVGVEPISENQGVTYVVVYPATEGLSLNELLLREGFAKWDRLTAPDNEAYETLQAGARESKRGVWSGRDPRLEGPWRFNLWRDGARATLTLRSDGSMTLEGKGDPADEKILGFEAAAAARRAQENAEMLAERRRAYQAWVAEQQRLREEAARQAQAQQRYRPPSNRIVVQRQVLMDTRGNVLFSTPLYVVR